MGNPGRAPSDGGVAGNAHAAGRGAQPHREQRDDHLRGRSLHLRVLRDLMTSTAPETVEDVQPAPARKQDSWLQRIAKFEITPKRVPLRELQQFSRQMAVFIKAGVPLIEALDLLREETGSKLFKRILDDIAASLHAGSTLSDAAGVHD